LNQFNKKQQQSLNIIADENIPHVKEVFASLGNVVTLAGRSITAADVKDADMLVVRSVTKVNGALLAGSKVRFVGTCTIGTDHLDIEYFAANNITFASAPGSNANSVVEYVFSCLARVKPQWYGARFGIVGCGNVGSRLYRRLKSLGLDCRYYDPLLSSVQEKKLGLSPQDSASLDEVLQADIICLHAPLTNTGAFPSRHMIGLSQLQSIRPGSLLLNAGRGPVIDNQALYRCLSKGQNLQVILDVWETEPAVSHELIQKMTKATPHIAGYSYDGKVKGTQMIYQAACHYLRKPMSHVGSNFLAKSPTPLALTSATASELLNQAILGGYDVDVDDKNMRAAIVSGLSARESSKKFDELRKNYPRRREFSAYKCELPVTTQLSSSEIILLRSQLTALGFQVGS
jgi:erythronate-4-phosphate dehydrogenase